MLVIVPGLFFLLFRTSLSSTQSVELPGGFVQRGVDPSATFREEDKEVRKSSKNSKKISDLHSELSDIHDNISQPRDETKSNSV